MLKEFQVAGRISAPKENWKEAGKRVMNKNDLISAVAEKTDLSRTASEKAVSALFDSIQDALAKGDRVSLVGFGTFEVRQRGPRMGRNPQTGATITIPSTRVPAFRAGKVLKDSIS